MKEQRVGDAARGVKHTKAGIHSVSFNLRQVERRDSGERSWREGESKSE